MRSEHASIGSAAINGFGSALKTNRDAPIAAMYTVNPRSGFAPAPARVRTSIVALSPTVEGTTAGPDQPKLAPTANPFLHVLGLVTVLGAPALIPKLPAANIGRKSGWDHVYSSTSRAKPSYSGASLPQLSL